MSDACVICGLAEHFHPVHAGGIFHGFTAPERKEAPEVERCAEGHEGGSCGTGCYLLRGERAAPPPEPTGYRCDALWGDAICDAPATHTDGMGFYYCAEHKQSATDSKLCVPIAERASGGDVVVVRSLSDVLEALKQRGVPLAA